MTSDEKQLLIQALTNSLAAKAVWQSLAVTAAAKGPVTQRLILDCLFAAQTRLDFDAVTNPDSEVGDISARARDQVRQFRDGLADVAASSSSLHHPTPRVDEQPPTREQTFLQEDAMRARMPVARRRK